VDGIGKPQPANQKQTNSGKDMTPKKLRSISKSIPTRKRPRSLRYWLKFLPVDIRMAAIQSAQQGQYMGLSHIVGSFVWEKSPQGQKYWERVFFKLVDYGL
jgi:hypothetical protein